MSLTFIAALILGSFALVQTWRLRDMRAELMAHQKSLHALRAGADRVTAQYKTLHRVQWVWRDVSTQLPAYLDDMSPTRKRLAWELGTLLPRLRIPVTPDEKLPDEALGDMLQPIQTLIHHVDDPALNALWDARSYLSLHELLRVLLFQTWEPECTGRPPEA